MSAPPKTLPPASNAARTWVKALNLLSPTTLFRTKKQLQEAQPSNDTTKPPMPVHVLETLAQLVDYLEENHRREEGLYKKESSALEWGDLKRICLSRGREDGARLPDLATLSPHAVTKVIKEILGHEFEPLIPYTLSQTLLDRVAQRDEITTLNEIVEKLKLLNASKRDFLKVFLIHLHHISTSIPCRMTAKQLATHIGVLLIRPVEDPRALSAKDLFKQRRRLARLMIENVSALPYDCESEVYLLQLSDTVCTAPTQAEPPIERQTETVIIEETRPLPAEPVHYIQVMWDAHNNAQTEDSLRTVLSPFGSIATLAINDSGSRAIVAFCTSEGAQAAAEAQLPHLRIRRRKPRSQPTGSLASSLEYPGSSPAPSPVDEAVKGDVASIPPPPITVPVTPAISEKPDAIVAAVADTGCGTEVEQVLQSPQSPQSSQASPADSPYFLHKLERPPSILLVQKAMKTLRGRDEMELEDVESLPTSPLQLADGDRGDKALGAIVEEPVVVERDDTQLPDTTVRVEEREPVHEMHESVVTQRRRSLKQLLTVSTTVNRTHDPSADGNSQKPKQSTAKKLFSPSTSTKIGFITDLKSRISKKPTPRSGSEARDPEPANPTGKTIQPHLEISNTASQTKPTICHSKRIQTTTTIFPLQDRATDTADLLPVETACDTIATPGAGREESVESELLTQHVVVLEKCLREVQSELKNLATALSATKHSNVDRAMLRAHEHLATRIDHVLQCTPAADAETEQEITEDRVDACQATREFVQFLETRSTTQVKILEAEVRAGQELLRLHRSQHQKEVAELEAEIASLRVTCKETEKMCSELRSELRQCRNELTCQVATAASIQRDRRDVDEKLVMCETKLRAKEQELLTLQLAHNEMQEVAATAQQRLDEYRGSNPVKRGVGDSPSITQLQKSTGLTLFPHTTAFFDKHRNPVEKGVALRGTTAKAEPNQLQPGTYSNTAELTAMQTRLQQRIHEQIVTTKASLKDMQQFDTKRLFEDDDDHDEEDEPDLDQLEQQLTSARAEMDAAMDESRQKLQELLEPKLVADRNHQSSRGSFDPSGLIEGLLAKALSDDWDGDNVRRDERYEEDPLGTVQQSRRWEDAELRSSQQSELFKKWLRDRAMDTHRSPPTTSSTASQKNSNVLREAEESMQRFQQTLAAMTTTATPRQ